MRVLILAGALSLLAACGKVAPEAPPEQNTATPAEFAIGDLSETDAQIQGCTRSLSRAGSAVNAGQVFVEDAIDSGAKGYIKIDGAVLTVTLVDTNADEQGGTRVFETDDHATRVVETLVTGAAHEEADSVEESGSIVVTHNGASQTLQVAGGTAC
jgi:hypothetical protein